MTLAEALLVADGETKGEAPKVIWEALQCLADEVRHSVDADIGRQLLPLAKAVVAEYSRDCALQTDEFFDAVDAVVDFVGDDEP